MAALCYLREPEVAFVPYAVEERVNISYLGEKVPSNINAISYARVGDSSCDNDCGFKEKIIEVEQGLIDSLEQVVGAGNVESR
ncbi:MAG TPA: hypothetical protein VK978_04335 [Candidatus Saccharimonadales bacterium]|nr:hypothetical protein [Candidatus Saccharimonadales bacterium]